MTIFIQSGTAANAQCADSTNVYSFSFGSTSYDVIKENKNWIEAAACAVERGGHLLEINSLQEQTAVFDELLNKAGIILSQTQNVFGKAQMWIGGSDLAIEGNWIWDGDNDGNGDQFWMGDFNGSPVGGLYTNWGREPDNSGGQDALVIVMEQTALSDPGEWNDLDEIDNILFYVIEYDGMSNTTDLNQSNNLAINVFPNPFKHNITFESRVADVVVREIKILNATGKTVKVFTAINKVHAGLDLTDLQPGPYFIEFTTNKGTSTHIIIAE